jgi:hypothetical protein
MVSSKTGLFNDAHLARLPGWWFPSYPDLRADRWPCGIEPNIPPGRQQVNLDFLFKRFRKNLKNSFSF